MITLANDDIESFKKHYTIIDGRQWWCNVVRGMGKSGFKIKSQKSNPADFAKSKRGNQMGNIIAYYRVSTKRQGQSGLGLDGQKAAVEEFARRQGVTILRDYTEVESGKRSDRPELAKAIGHAKLAKVTLVVARLDRLARNVAFLSSLMESGIDFIACDNPNATS